MAPLISVIVGVNKPKYNILFSNIYIFTSLVYSSWIFVGVIFYRYYDGWTGPTAFYYAIQAGLNIGFEYPQEPDDGSRMFTIIYVLVGSSAVYGCLGLLIAKTLYFTKAPLTEKLKSEQLKKDSKKSDLLFFIQYYYYRVLEMIGWYSNRPRIFIFLFFIIWMFWGTVFAARYEDWDVITAIYFTVTSSATAGLQEPLCVANTDNDPTHCDMGNVRGIVYGIFFMVAVPLYAYTFSQFAALVIRRAVEVRDIKLLQSPIIEEEFNYASNILTLERNSNSLDLGEYILFELIRIGKINQSQIEKLKTKFTILTDGTNRLTLAILKLKEFVILKINESNTNYNEQNHQRIEDADGSNKSTNITNNNGIELANIIPTNPLLLLASDAKANHASSIHDDEVESNITESYATNPEHNDDKSISKSNTVEELKESLFTTSYKRLVEYHDYFVSDIYLMTIVLYGLWTILGTIFYTYYDGWTWATGYYFAMQAGLVIGMNNIHEKDDNSRVFTTFYILTGSIYINGCLSLFISNLLFPKPKIIRTELTWDFISIRDESGRITGDSFIKFLTHQLKYWSGWYSNQERTSLVVIFLFWTAFGVIFGMISQEWSFITALYFSITTMSTGGLQSPNCETGFDTTCDMGSTGVIVGIFMMFGVPIYASTLGYFANQCIKEALDEHENHLMSLPIHEIEFMSAVNLLNAFHSEDSAGVDVKDKDTQYYLSLGEFILMELIRLNLTTKGQVEHIKRVFHRIDTHNKGKLDLEDLHRYGKIKQKSHEERVLLEKQLLASNRHHSNKTGRQSSN